MACLSVEDAEALAAPRQLVSRVDAIGVGEVKASRRPAH